MLALEHADSIELDVLRVQTLEQPPTLPKENWDDVQFEFAAGTPAPSFVRRQGANVVTATRVP